jgi:hypothetical protein
MERRLTAAGGPQDVEDAVIEEWAEAAPEDVDRDRSARQSDAAPFDLGVPEPRAMDLRKLWKLAGQEPDPQILAALGPTIPILLSHSVTAFPAGDGRPPRVWGIRYSCRLVDLDSRTVAVQPTTELLDVLTVGAEAELEVGLDGGLSVPRELAAGLSVIPGLALNEARVSAGVTESARLRIRFTLSVPKVISGPEAQGGARWHLYAQDQRLDGHQALIQTVLVPRDTRHATVEIESAIAAAGWFGPREWRYETATFDISFKR